VGAHKFPQDHNCRVYRTRGSPHSRPAGVGACATRAINHIARAGVGRTSVCWAFSATCRIESNAVANVGEFRKTRGNGNSEHLGMCRLIAAAGDNVVTK
jgi:hypothetical protein